MARKLIFIVGIIVALAAVGAGAFYGGTVYAANQASTTRNAFFNGRGGTGTGAGAGGGAGANGAGFGGGGVAGTIKSINGNTVEVSTAQNVTTVTLSAATTVEQTVAAAASDLQVGQTVTVRGTRDSAGNVAATSIQVVPAGTTFGGPGGGGNGGPAHGHPGAIALAGAIEPARGDGWHARPEITPGGKTLRRPGREGRTL